jgi:hypothetical protein
MTAIRRALVSLALACFSGAGLAQHARIDTASFQAPKEIVLVDLPRMLPAAHIGVLTMYMPGINQHHFTERTDRFFEVPATASKPGDVASAPVLVAPGQLFSQGILPGLIMSHGQETERRAAGFEGEILKIDPGFDLRASFLTALVQRLQANGVAVRLDETGRQSMPRMRWPALDANGKAWPTGAADSAPPVDADLLVQLCPVAFYQAAGALNSYRRSATVAVVVYDGRSKKFIGRQTFRFVPPDSRFQYSSYDSLLAELKDAAPALRDALLGLAVPVADVISGKATPH